MISPGWVRGCVVVHKSAMHHSLNIRACNANYSTMSCLSQGMVAIFPLFIFFLGIICLDLAQWRREAEQKVALLWMKDSAFLWSLTPPHLANKSHQIMKNTHLKFQESKMISSFSPVTPKPRKTQLDREQWIPITYCSFTIILVLKVG